MTGSLPVLDFLLLYVSVGTTALGILLAPRLCGNSLPFLPTQMAAPGYESPRLLCQGSNPHVVLLLCHKGSGANSKWMTGKDYTFLGRLWCLFCTTSLIKNPWQYINHRLMDLNMPIKHNEINANVKAQTLCLGIFKGLKLYPQSVVRKRWEKLGPLGAGFAHCNLNIGGMTSQDWIISYLGEISG